MIPLHEAAIEYAAEKAAPGSVADVAVQRAFMAGALETLARVRAGENRDALWQQVIQYGATIGTKLEVAR